MSTVSTAYFEDGGAPTAPSIAAAVVWWGSTGQGDGRPGTLPSLEMTGTKTLAICSSSVPSSELSLLRTGTALCVL